MPHKTHSFYEEPGSFQLTGGGCKDTFFGTGNFRCARGCGTRLDKESLGRHVNALRRTLGAAECRGVKDHVLHPDSGVCVGCKADEKDLHPDRCPNNA